MRLRTSQAYANECADPVFAGGADVTPANVERELGNIKPGKVPHPGDGIEPENPKALPEIRRIHRYTIQKTAPVRVVLIR